MAGKRANEAFLFGELTLWHPSFAQAIEETIAVFVNPVRTVSHELLNSEMGCKFQKRLYCIVGVVEPVQFDVRTGQKLISTEELRGLLDRFEKSAHSLVVLLQ